MRILIQNGRVSQIDANASNDLMAQQSLYAILNQLNKCPTPWLQSKKKHVLFCGNSYVTRTGLSIQVNEKKIRTLLEFFHCKRGYVWTPLGWCLFLNGPQWVRSTLVRVLTTTVCLGVVSFMGYMYWLNHWVSSHEISTLNQPHAYPVHYANWVLNWESKPINIPYLDIDSTGKYSLIGVIIDDQAPIDLPDETAKHYVTKNGNTWLKLSGQL